MGETQHSKGNAYWSIGIIVFLVYCIFTSQLDLFIVVLCTGGVGIWLFSGMVDKVKNLVPKRKVFNSNKPDGPMPTERVKTVAEVKVTEDVAGEIETPAIVLSKVDKKWFDNLVKNAVHILVIGETNSGKSTAAKALLNARANKGEQIIILDPHARPSTWNGLDAIGKGRDYDAIEHMLGVIQAEMINRYKLYAEDDTYNPVRLNIFIDEIPSIASTCESWQEFFTVLSCEARKVNMSLICLTQSRLVDMLGIKGRSDVRENFSEILLGDKAIKVISDASKQTRPAVVDYNGRVSMVDTSMLPALGNAEINQNVLWVPSINLVPENGVQSVTGASDSSITTSPLTEEEMIMINDWDDEGLSRRAMARNIYRSRGGVSTTYTGDGKLFQYIKNFLDSEP